MMSGMIGVIVIGLVLILILTMTLRLLRPYGYGKTMVISVMTLNSRLTRYLGVTVTSVFGLRMRMASGLVIAIVVKSM
jgi:hypothetical protein